MSGKQDFDGDSGGEGSDDTEEITFRVTRRRNRVVEEAVASGSNLATSKRELVSSYIEGVCGDMKERVALYHGYMEILEELSKIPEDELEKPQMDYDASMGNGDLENMLSAELQLRVLGILSDIATYGTGDRSTACRACLDVGMYEEIEQYGLFSSENARIRQVVESWMETNENLDEPLVKFKSIMSSMFTGEGKSRMESKFDKYPGIARDVALAYNDFILEKGKRDEMVEDVGEDVVDGFEDAIPEVDPFEDIPKHVIDNLPDDVADDVRDGVGATNAAFTTEGSEMN